MQDERLDPHAGYPIGTPTANSRTVLVGMLARDGRAVLEEGSWSDRLCPGDFKRALGSPPSKPASGNICTNCDGRGTFMYREGQPEHVILNPPPRLPQVPRDRSTKGIRAVRARD